ncbi:unnamed protein product [Hanseniaspora opuntiae]
MQSILIFVYTRKSLFPDRNSSYCAEYQLLHQYLKDYNLQYTLEANYDKIKKNVNDQVCQLSNNAINHLNVFSNKVTKSKINTLWGLLNNQNILTSYGKDKLINWIKNPLIDIEEIKSRNEAIVFFDRNAVFSNNLEFSIKNFFILSKYDHSEDINKIEREISLIEEKKMAQLEEYKNLTGKPYLAFHENKFDIILRTAEYRGLPENWRFLGRHVKNKYNPMNLYRAPELDDLEIQLEEKNKELLNACDAEYRYFLERLNTNYERVHEIIDILASIDCLRCLGLSTSHFTTTPTFVKESGIITLEDAHNPMLDFDKSYLINSNTQSIPNTINLQSDKLFILTGLNAGGKTTIMKKVAYLCILAQIGCNTPCLFHKQSIFTSIDIRTGSSDSIIAKTSTLLNEMLEYKDIMENSMCERSLVLLDEIGRGTSHKDGTSLTYAFLKDLKEKGKSKGIVMFVTHYHDLLKDQTDFDADEIYKMGFYSVTNEQ